MCEIKMNIFCKKIFIKRHDILTDIIYCRKFTDKEMIDNSIIEELYSSGKNNSERILYYVKKYIGK